MFNFELKQPQDEKVLTAKLHLAVTAQQQFLSFLLKSRSFNHPPTRPSSNTRSLRQDDYSLILRWLSRYSAPRREHLRWLEYSRSLVGLVVAVLEILLFGIFFPEAQTIIHRLTSLKLLIFNVFLLCRVE